MIFATCPTRIDLAGGWTDVPLFAKEQIGYVLNVAINLCSKVSIEELPPLCKKVSHYGHKVIEAVPDSSIHLYSADFDQSEEIENIKSIELTGSLALAKAALKRLPHSGISIITSSEAPSGSGLGTSASMGVALIGGLACYNRIIMFKHEIAELAVKLETEELGILSGKQDHYAAALGGISLMEFQGEKVTSWKLDIPRSTLLELRERLILCYTGTSRLSSKIHETVVANFLREDEVTLSSLRSLSSLAQTMARKLIEGNLNEVGSLMLENWEYQKRLSTAITNEKFDRVIKLALANGAIGAKACGAGGQGCLVILTELGMTEKVKRAMKGEVELLKFDFDFDGLRTKRS